MLWQKGDDDEFRVKRIDSIRMFNTNERRNPLRRRLPQTNKYTPLFPYYLSSIRWVLIWRRTLTLERRCKFQEIRYQLIAEEIFALSVNEKIYKYTIFFFFLLRLLFIIRILHPKNVLFPINKLALWLIIGVFKNLANRRGTRTRGTKKTIQQKDREQ